MSRKYCVIKENKRMRTLLSIIKSHYNSDNKDSLQEVNLGHVLNNIDNLDIRTIVKNAWHDLQITIGYEIRLLENNCKKSFINRLYKKSNDLNFMVTRADNNLNSINNSAIETSNLQIEVKYINI